MIEERSEAQTKEADGAKKAKPITEWTKKELEFSNLNSRALGTLINGMTQMNFIKS